MTAREHYAARGLWSDGAVGWSLPMAAARWPDRIAVALAGADRPTDHYTFAELLGRVEAALSTDPSVRDAVVVGVPDERLGELPVALVTSAPDAVATGDAVLDAVRPRLAPYKRPHRVFVVADLPRVANGKVDRPRAAQLGRELAAHAEAAS